ncbi:4Fe-4S binding protein [[Eubacterium] cellulosolvens]
MITKVRHIVQLSWLIIFANGVLFGLPEFGSNPSLRYIFIPNLTTKYFVYTPTHCYFFELQSSIQTGYSQGYVNILLPLLVVIILLLILARFWCGWLCPLGFVQDLMMYLRRLFRVPYLELNYPSIRILDRTKFAILFIVIVIVFLVSLPTFGLLAFQSELTSPFEQFCPARPLFVFSQQVLGWEPWSTGVPFLGIVVLGFFFVTSFFVRKFYCRICPVGAINSFFNKYSLLTLQKDGTKCTKCRICLRACPMDIEEIYEEKGKTNISSKECIHCYRCVEVCPEDDCLSVAFLQKRILYSKHPADRLSGAILKNKLFKTANNKLPPPPRGGTKP